MIVKSNTSLPNIMYYNYKNNKCCKNDIPWITYYPDNVMVYNWYENSKHHRYNDLPSLYNNSYNISKVIYEKENVTYKYNGYSIIYCSYKSNIFYKGICIRLLKNSL